VTVSGGHQGQPAGEPLPQPTGGALVAGPPRVPGEAERTAAGQAAVTVPATVAPATAGTAAAIATAQAAALPRAAAAVGTTHVSPPAPPGGPGAEVEPDQVGTPTGRASRALPRLRIGYHLASDAALARFSLTLSASGLLLGQDIDQRPASVRLFRPEPVRMALVGGAWLSQLLLFRVLTLGARVAIMSAQPEVWNGFGEWATGRADRVGVLPLDRPVLPPASAAEPGLVVWDAGPLGPSAPLALGPWLTQLTMITQLTPYGLPAVQDAGLVITQRLAAAEAEVATNALLLDPETARVLQLLEENMVALLGGGTPARYVWLTPTGAEQQHLGQPRR
jgi:hypothetical protein